MNPAVFKAYDIRARSPEELDISFARRLGQVLAHIYQPKTVVVGHDMRTTSSMLVEGVIDGLRFMGVDVVAIGLCSTPMLSFAVGSSDGAYDLGVMVTASHNPARDNGFKLVRAGCVPIGAGSGMEEIRDLACSDTSFATSAFMGSLTRDESVLSRYVAAVWRSVGFTESPQGRIAVDAGNGMGGLTLPLLRDQYLTSINVIPLYWDLDGRFPNHEANPLKTETLHDVIELVKRESCLMGVALDGDGDRVGCVDEEGTPIPGDIMTALLAREILSEHGTGKILMDVRSSWSTSEAIREAGGTPVYVPVGHAKIKKEMRERKALFGGEVSMHFYFSDFWNCEVSERVLLLILKMLGREKKPLSVMWQPLVRYANSGELNFEVHDIPATLGRLQSLYDPVASERITLDGLRYEFRSLQEPVSDWWFCVRASNTEPLLRLIVEARTPELLAQRVAELTQRIKHV